MMLQRRSIYLFAFLMAILLITTRDVVLLNKFTISETTIQFFGPFDDRLFTNQSIHSIPSTEMSPVIRLLDIKAINATNRSKKDIDSKVPSKVSSPRPVKPKVLRGKQKISGSEGTTSTPTTSKESTNAKSTIANINKKLVNYTMEQTVANGTSATLKPLLIWEEWVRHHSAQVLQQESIEQLRARKYIQVTFNCPRQAGIATSAFLDGLLVALVTNRTLLVEYGGFWGWIRKGDNSRDVCFRLVQPAPWIPWLNKFPVKAVFNGTELSGVSTLHKNKAAMQKIDAGLRVVKDASHHPLIRVSHAHGLGRARPGWARLRNFADRYLWEFWNQALGMAIPLDSVVQDLYKYGHFFVYGMLLWKSFPFTNELMESVQDQIREDNDDFYTIGMHSRHVGSKTGVDVSRELKCLDTLLRRNITRPCRLFLMTDRPITLSKVAAYGKEKYGCESIYIPAYEGAKTANITSEHGPLAGAPYYQDLAVVSQAQDAYMITARSSSALLSHLIEYRRVLEGKTKEIERCWI